MYTGLPPGNHSATHVFVLPQVSGNVVGTNAETNYPPNNLSNMTLEEKVINGFIFITEVTNGTPLPMSFPQIIFC